MSSFYVISEHGEVSWSVLCNTPFVHFRNNSSPDKLPGITPVVPETVGETDPAMEVTCRQFDREGGNRSKAEVSNPCLTRSERGMQSKALVMNRKIIVEFFMFLVAIEVYLKKSICQV